MSGTDDVLRRAADAADLDIWIRDLPRPPAFMDPPDGYAEAQWDRIAEDLSAPGGYLSIRALVGGLRDALEKESQRVLEHERRVQEEASLAQQEAAEGERQLPTGQPVSRPSFYEAVANAQLTRAMRRVETLEYRLGFVEQALLEYEVFGVAVRYAERAPRPFHARFGEEEEIFISRAISGIKQVEEQEGLGLAARSISALKEAILTLESDPEPNASPHTSYAIDKLFEGLGIYKGRLSRGRPKQSDTVEAYEYARVHIQRLAHGIGLTSQGEQESNSG